MALEYIRDNELGVVIYLEQEGRGIGLANKIAAYKVQESGADTVDANRKLGLPDDIREYSAVRNIVDDLNIKSVALMTNNPRKINELEKEGVNVTSRIPCVTKANLFSEKYLEAKRTTRLNINSQLRKPKGFRNPNFLQSVVEHFGVEQDGSELPGRREQKKQEEEEDSYEKIAARQRAEAEDRIRNRTNISFVQQNEESFGGPDAQELIDKAREQARMLNARMAAKGQR